MGDRHLCEAGLDRHLGDASLVLREAIAVHEDDGDAAETLGVYGFKIRPHAWLVEWGHDIATRADAFGHFNYFFVQQLGQANFAVEDARAVLIGDSQRVAEAFRGEERRRLALALKQSVGGDSCSHFHRLDVFDRNGRAVLDAEQPADACNRGVAILFGILRQEFVSDERAVGALRDDVGESAAAVDPKLPTG